MTNDERILVDKYVKELARGNEDAFDKLYNFVKPHLLVIAKSYIKNNEDAEEIIDDVFDQLSKSAPFFLFYKNCYRWLCTTTLNKARNLVELKNNREEISKTMSFPSHITLNESSIILKIEIKDLPTEEMQLIVFYKYFCNFKISHICKLLKMSRSQIYRELNLSLKILKEKLKWN